MTLLEVVLVLGILTVAFGMFSTTMMANNRTRVINRDTAISAEAARAVFETMHNVEFGEVFARYNSDPADDPDGPGTAPGSGFSVPGLDPLPGDADGFVGHVVLPESEALPVWQLREDFADANLGLPRDLNGDSIVDDQDHALDYLILPVRIEIEWQGRFGPRRMTASTMLTDIRKAGE